MLSRLYVKNIALIKEADIEFDSGLNVLSGETGSGKSIILDSINFVLGSKADKTMIRHGEQEALVKAEFKVDGGSEAVAVLKDYDIDSEGEIIISRKFSIDGKNNIKINGNSVTLAMLKAVTLHLVDVHGQSEHFFLLNENNQLKVIDSLLGENAENIKKQISSYLTEKRQLKDKISLLGGDETERERKLDLLEYQIKEIENADLKIGEFEELKERRNKILNVEKILSAVNFVKDCLNEDGGVSDKLYSSSRELGRISGISEEYNNILIRLEAVGDDVADIASSLTDIADSLTFDENEAQAVEDRISLIKSLIKKYGATEEEIIAYKDRITVERDAIFNSTELIERYTKQIEDCDDKIYALCVKLSDLRKQTAKTFCKSVEAELRTLNIPDAVFNIKFNEFTRETANLQSSNGCDEVYFEFSANKGEPVKPLSKVISGGEISRFMLAVKTQLKNLNGISTYIFDEIDAGISGYTADTVARKFKNMAQSTQILAVSHLPQICAASDTQYLIFKKEDGGNTYTYINKLNDEQRIEEIIRLIGNVNSQSAHQHAVELIKQYKN
ncbi:MAG: DNA repair protein RecN [Clostridia bacterium]|nr:DNA repair protein RecN [Clostridia bacterium]